MEEYRNQVTVIGRIITISKTEHGYTFRVQSKQGGSSNGGNDTQPIFHYKGELPEWVTERARAEVRGHVAPIRFQGTDKKWRDDQQYIATEFIKEKTLCMNEFGIDGYYFRSPYATVNLMGKVTSITEDNGFYRIHIFVKSEEGDFPVRINLEKKSEYSDPLRIKVDDFMCCVCTIETKVKEAHGKKHTYYNLRALDFAKV